MLTPDFSCEQDASFVIVKLKLGALCRISKASFSIADELFVFYCDPYLLKLQFSSSLTEGAGERATFHTETLCLRVFLPKLEPGKVFKYLNEPQRLLVSFVDAEPPLPLPASSQLTETISYGFNADCSNVFTPGSNFVLDLPQPESTRPELRTQLREVSETDAFDPDALDEESNELEDILQFKSDYVLLFESLLRTSPPECTSVEMDQVPSPAITSAMENPVTKEWTVWCGNIMTPDPFFNEITAIEETIETVTSLRVQQQPSENPVTIFYNPPVPHTSTKSLAFPNQPSPTRLTMEENGILIRFPLYRCLGVAENELMGLLVDLLAPWCYNHIINGGDDCCEASWNLVKLSPSLSWLDAPPSIAVAAQAFSRRVLAYPLYRSKRLAERSLRDVTLLLRLGWMDTLRVLLQIHSILEKTDGFFPLSLIFTKPLIGYLLYIGADKSVELFSKATQMLHDELRD